MNTPLRDSARQAVALLPCPFCGSKVILTGEPWMQSEESVGCDDCNAETGTAEQWNRRALVRALPDGEELPELPAGWIRPSIPQSVGAVTWMRDGVQVTSLAYAPDQMSAYAIECVKDALAYATPAQATRVGEWIPVGERLPEKEGCYLCVIRQEGAKSKGYVSLVCYGSYEFYCEDDSPRLKPGESFNEDEGMVTGHGWHNEEDSHGGEYDTYVVTYRAGSSRGEVSHWMPRPELPADLQAAATQHPAAVVGGSDG